MKILPLTYNKNFCNTQNNNPNFSSKKYFTKSELLNSTKNIKSYAESISNDTQITKTTIEKVFKKYGITKFDLNNNIIIFHSGYNKGYYKIKSHIIMSETVAKNYIATVLLSDLDLPLARIKNYMSMVNDLKRQDLIIKGLQLNNDIISDEHTVNDITRSYQQLSKLTNRILKKDKLFCINNRAIYYNENEKTAYSININSKNMEQAKKLFTVCHFKTDKQGNAIGYETKKYDYIKGKLVDIEYIEQQNPSRVIPQIITLENNNFLVEAFRFGNSEMDYDIKCILPNIINDIKTKTKNNNIQLNELKLIRFDDKNRHLTARVIYYDPTIDCTFVYNTDGKYMYLLEFGKDSNGKLISFSKI